jgi:hypothetical protein
MRFGLILAAFSGAVLLASPEAMAAPSQARWCLNGGSQNVTTGECVYRTLDQCVQDRIGEGGHCDPNPNGPPADR